MITSRPTARCLDQHLDLERNRAALKPFYSSTGRSSVDPQLMIRMLLVGYCMVIRSERDEAPRHFPFALPSIFAEQSQFPVIPSFSDLSGRIPGSSGRSVQSGVR